VVDFVPDPGLHHRHRPPRLLVAAHQHRPPRGDRRAQRTAQFEMSARPTRNAAASTAQTVSPNVCPRNVNTATLVVGNAGRHGAQRPPERIEGCSARSTCRAATTVSQTVTHVRPMHAEALSAVSVRFQIPSTHNNTGELARIDEHVARTTGTQRGTAYCNGHLSLRLNLGVSAPAVFHDQLGGFGCGLSHLG